MKRQGLFNLQTPRDLLKKAEHDLGRLQLNPHDVYAAWDFFVTIRHLPEWLYPDAKDHKYKEKLFTDHVELRIARHLGSQIHILVFHATPQPIQSILVLLEFHLSFFH